MEGSSGNVLGVAPGLNQLHEEARVGAQHRHCIGQGLCSSVIWAHRIRDDIVSNAKVRGCFSKEHLCRRKCVTTASSMAAIKGDVGKV